METRKGIFISESGRVYCILILGTASLVHMDAQIIMPWVVCVCVKTTRAPQHFGTSNVCSICAKERISYHFCCCCKHENRKKNTTCSSSRQQGSDGGQETGVAVVLKQCQQHQPEIINGKTFRWRAQPYIIIIIIIVVIVFVYDTNTLTRAPPTATAQHIIHVPLCLVPYTDTCSM